VDGDHAFERALLLRLQHLGWQSVPIVKELKISVTVSC